MSSSTRWSSSLSWQGFQSPLFWGLAFLEWFFFLFFSFFLFFFFETLVPLWFLVWLFLDKVLWEVLWGFFCLFVLFFSLENKSKDLSNVRKSVVMNTTRQKPQGRMAWEGQLQSWSGEVAWPMQRGAWEAEGQGRHLCSPVKACWYFLWQPGAALSSKRVSGMLEAGVWNIIKRKYSVQFEPPRVHVTETEWQAVWKGTLRKREPLPDCGVKNSHKLI